MKSLVVIKYKSYRVKKSSKQTIAMVVNSNEEVMKKLPIFVDVGLTCDNDDCDQLVCAKITIKTSKKNYKILAGLSRKMVLVHTDIKCPICGDIMKICEVELS